MTKTHAYLTVLFVLIAQLYTRGQVVHPLDSIDQKISEIMKEHKTVGLAIAIVKGDSLIYAKGYGHRDLMAKLPANENTAFHIASMSKAFTGALLGKLEARQLLSLHDKPAKYIADFHFYNDKMDNLITIGDLLSHRSGIGNHGSSIVLFPDENKLNTVRRLKYLRPEGEIKNSWIYSNIGYTLAGTIAEQVTNKTWDENVQAELFAPLNMNNSYTSLEPMIASNNYAKGYALSQGEILDVPYENYYAYTPAGAIKSSVKDLSHWMMAWLNQGQFKGNQVIPTAYVRAASRLQNMKQDDYEQDAFLYGEGYGWRLRAWNGKYRMRHGGNTMGFSSIMDLYPFEGIGVVVLCNQKSSLVPYEIAEYLSRKLMDIPTIDFPTQVFDIYRGSNATFPLNTEKLPTNPINEFVGVYDAKGYGTINIIIEDQKLMAVLPTYRFQLAHQNYNVFTLKGTADFSGEFNPEFNVEFINDRRGNIIQMKLYSQKEPVVFYKQ